jgi:hypothetical protein
MIGQILSNNNEKYYSNFSPAFRKVNTHKIGRLVGGGGALNKKGMKGFAG